MFFVAALVMLLYFVGGASSLCPWLLMGRPQIPLFWVKTLANNMH